MDVNCQGFWGGWANKYNFAECHNEKSIVSAGGITGSVTMHDATDLDVDFKDNTIKLNSNDQIEASGGTVYRGYLYGFERSYELVDNIRIPNTDGNRLVLGGVKTMIVGPNSEVQKGDTYHIIN